MAIPIGNVAIFGWDSGVLMDGREQKVGGRGCEGFRPIVGRRVGKSQKCVFRLFPSRAHGGSLCAPLTSLAARRKSRFAEKKSAPPKKNCACRKKWRIVCIKGGMSLPVVTCHNRPSPRLTALATAFSKLRSAAPRLHGVVHDTPSPMASLPLAAI